jgi:hypothetical protein
MSVRELFDRLENAIDEGASELEVVVLTGERTNAKEIHSIDFVVQQDGAPPHHVALVTPAASRAAELQGKGLELIGVA